MKSLIQCKEWFIRKGIYYTFLRYIHNNAKTFEGLYEHSKAEMIDAAFIWSNTPEGRNFWSDINDEFIDWFFNDNEKVLKPKSLFNIKDRIIINSNLSNNIVEINEDMLKLSGKKATIIDIDYFCYCTENKEQDGCFYYIKEDNSIHSWINSMFKKQ